LDLPISSAISATSGYVINNNERCTLNQGVNGLLAYLVCKGRYGELTICRTELPGEAHFDPTTKMWKLV